MNNTKTRYNKPVVELADYLPGQAPFSQEAEEAVLGAVMINPEAFVKIAAFLKPEDFYFMRHQFIWAAMERIIQRHEIIDFVSVQEELRKLGRINDIGGAARLTQLTTAAPSSMHAELYGRIVERTSFRRRLLEKADEIKRLAVNEEMDCVKVALDAEQRLAKATGRMLGMQQTTMAEALADYYQTILQNAASTSSSAMGVPTGIPELDALIGGLRRKLFYGIAGVPVMGKTDLLLNLLWHAASLGEPSLFLSLEMSKADLINRLVSLLTAIPHERLRRGTLKSNEWDRVEKAIERIANAPFEILDFAHLGRTPFATIELAAEAWRTEHGLSILGIDYISLVSSKDGASEDGYSENVFGMNHAPQLASRLNCAVVAASQINTETMGRRKDGRPTKADLFMKNDRPYDVLLGIYNEYTWRTLNHRKTDDVNPTEAEIIVMKNRHGKPGGIVPVVQRGEISTFSKKPKTEPIEHWSDK